MRFIIAAYERLVVGLPRLLLIAILVVVGYFAYYVPNLRLDASADSLFLEEDRDLRYYRDVTARYGSDDYLIITYKARSDLFAPESIADLKSLRAQLQALPGVASVTTMLDVPLIDSPPVTLKQLREEVPNLLSPRTDLELARQELTESPLYRQLIMSTDARTTAVLLTLNPDPVYESLLGARDGLRDKAMDGELTLAEQRKVDMLSEQIKARREMVTARHGKTIAQIRQILDGYRNRAELHLGGLPIIITDMLDYIMHDFVVFGAGILVFLIGLLWIIFIQPRWVLLSVLCCLLSVVVMLGFLGLIDWPLTAVSANFAALLLIFSLSVTVHLIVHYRELHTQNSDQDQRWLVWNTVRDMFKPCACTALTSMVAFASLLVSGIRPIIDFGWMMVLGIGLVLLMAFTLFPAALMMLSPSVPPAQRDMASAITGFFARAIQRGPKIITAVYVALAVVSVIGMASLTVENRFIDNFRISTEIYQGLLTIDRELGGTTPVDIILDADPDFFIESAANSGSATDDEFDDEFGDEFDDEYNEDDLGATSYWYNSFRLAEVNEVHQFLESLPETGKVLSMATTIDTLRSINEDEEPTTFWLSLIYKNLPADVKEALFDPYMSSDGNQLRFSARVLDSDPTLQRAELLETIQTHLVNEMGFMPEQVHVTGMLVLYNNVLQSLYRSQILTLGFVFLAITAIFWMLYQSLTVALVAMIPNLLAAGAVLGVMGLFAIPLNIMTITIAAIIIGVAIDDTVHYLHRFQIELNRDGDYRGAVRRAHYSIGRAMTYTTVIIAAGFSILMLSNFMPTVYFGLFTALAMVFALIANLTLLPLLLVWVKPMRSPNN